MIASILAVGIVCLLAIVLAISWMLRELNSEDGYDDDDEHNDGEEW